MRIAIIGYGRMGKAIESLAQERGHDIAAIIRSSNKSKIHQLADDQIDVAIEFSTPSSVINNLESLIEQSIPVVCGTTAWHQQYDRICKLTKDHDSALLYASNYSVGMNLMFRFNKEMAKIMSHFDQYQPSITEIHHIHKLDAPSGSAVTLAEDILDSRPDLQNWHLAEENEENGLPIEAIREGEVIGTHHVKYSSSIDQLQISHIAHNRDGFALGAVLAAEFLNGKKGIFTMEDVLSSALK